MTPCDKCGSKSLYRDYDHVHGVCDIVCRICGKRWPVGADPHLSTILRQQQEEKDMEKGPLPAGLREVLQSGKMELENQEILQLLKKEKGPSPEAATSKKPRRRPCSNCGRNLFIVGHDRCFTCDRAAGKLKGEALTAALVEIKRRIDAGEIVRGGVRGPRRKSTAPIVDKSFTPAPTPKVEGTAKKDPASGAIVAGSTLGNSPKVEGLSAALEAVRAEWALPEAIITLVFSEDRDQALYAALLKESIRTRRSVEQ